MVVGRGGYVGMVRVEDGRSHLAAALSPHLVQRSYGIHNACASILSSAGILLHDELANAKWLGAPPLSRRTFPLADRNVLLLGDAAGYVEPFTGEGMTWAMLSALEAVPFVERAVTGEDVAPAWTHHQALAAGQRQRWCGLIAAGLRSTWLTSTAIDALRLWPQLAAPFVRRISERPIPSILREAP